MEEKTYEVGRFATDMLYPELCPRIRGEHMEPMDEEEEE